MVAENRHLNKGALFFLGHRCTHSAAHLLKRFKPLLALYYAKVIAELEKTQTTVTVLIIRPGSTLKFQFVFGFNGCL